MTSYNLYARVDGKGHQKISHHETATSTLLQKRYEKLEKEGRKPLVVVVRGGK